MPAKTMTINIEDLTPEQLGELRQQVEKQIAIDNKKKAAEEAERKLKTWQELQGTFVARINELQKKIKGINKSTTVEIPLTLVLKCVLTKQTDKDFANQLKQGYFYNIDAEVSSDLKVEGLTKIQTKALKQATKDVVADACDEIFMFFPDLEKLMTPIESACEELAEEIRCAMQENGIESFDE